MIYLSLALALFAELATPPKLVAENEVRGRVLLICDRGAVLLCRDGAVRFAPFADALRRGLPPAWTGHRGAYYPVAAVRVGDYITGLLAAERGSRYLCESLQIMERPGGQVPPACGERTDFRAFHQVRNESNAEQKAARDARIAQRLAGTYVPPPRKKKPAEPQP